MQGRSDHTYPEVAQDPAVLMAANKASVIQSESIH